MRRIAIIPARGGSKRIPGKNKKNFLGKPIITYSIEAAVKSKLFDVVMVSTDDEKIAQIALESGANVPFFRSSEMSNDYATLADVLKEVLNAYQQKGEMFDVACCLLPTAPFVTSKKLVEANEKIINDNLDVVFPVVEFSFPIQRALKIEDSFLSMVNPEHLNSRSQDLDARYHDAGQFYLLKVASFLEENKIYLHKAGAIITSVLEVQDIDNETDWQLAELKYGLL